MAETLYQEIYRKSLTHADTLSPIEACILYHGVYGGGEEHALEAADELAALRARVAELEAGLSEANQVMLFINNEDMQIMENGYQAEEMAGHWLSKYSEIIKSVELAKKAQS